MMPLRPTRRCWPCTSSRVLSTRLLSQASRAAVYTPNVLEEIAATRTEVRGLFEMQADVLADLERAIEALEPDEPPLTVEDR
jgi:hypothetical protein